MRGTRLVLLALAIAGCAAPSNGGSPRIMADVPAAPDAGARYLFHMHGSIVEELGPSARGRYGQYQYYPTVEALADRGFVVISEVRGATEPRAYAAKVAAQVARLRAAGVPADHITVTGVSKGGSMTLMSVFAVANPDVRFVIMAGCLRGGGFARAIAALGNRPPQGRVLSLYDYADPDIGSCSMSFPPTPGLAFEEVVFQTGLGHALFFSPEPVWVDRVAAWATAP